MTGLASIAARCGKAALGVIVALALALPQAGIAWAAPGDGAAEVADELQVPSEGQLQAQSDGQAGLTAQATQALARKVLPDSEPSLVPLDQLKGNNWMAGISGSLYLHEINIPGTHDSAMWDPYAPRNIAKTMGSYAKTQTLDVGQQMNAGMRLFDLRLTNVYRPGIAGFFGDGNNRTKGDQGLYLVHGAYKNWKGDWRFYGDQSKGVLQFEKLMGWFTTFLTMSPTETIILDITYESDSGDHDVTMARAREQLEPYYTKINPKTGKPFIYTQNGSKTITTMPTLAETRGQIVLMSSTNDLKLGMSYGWTADWNGRDIAGVHFSVENHFEVTKDQKKVLLGTFLRGGETDGVEFSDPKGGVRQDVPANASANPTTRSALICTSSNRPPVVTDNPHQTPKEIAEAVNMDVYLPGTKALVEPGYLSGWTYSDFMEEKYAKAFWMANFPSNDNERYATVTYKATVDGKTLTKTKRFLKGSKIRMPSDPFDKDSKGKSQLGDKKVGSWTADGDRSAEVGAEVTLASDVVYTANFSLSWSGLQVLINQTASGGTIELPSDVTALVVDTPLTIPAGKAITINMNGHTLDKAGRASNSGGVFQVCGELTLTGPGTVKGGNAAKGGGVWMSTESARLTATKVTFSANSASDSGGGIFAAPNSVVALDGCTVTGNNAKSGGGVFVASGARLNVAGAMNITGNFAGGAANNVQLARLASSSPASQYSAVITVTGPLSGVGHIGVTSEVTPTAAASVIVTSGLNGRGSADFFTSDKENLAVVQQSSEAALSAGTRTVSFDVGGGTPVASQSVRRNGKATLPAAPTKEGSVFGGWFIDAACTRPYDFNAPVTEDITVYARWVAQESSPGDEKHTVQFVSNGPADIPSQVVENEDTATEPHPPPENPGFTFGGWYTDAECTQEYDFSTLVTGDIVLYAKWAARYEVFFATDGGTEIDAQTVDEGDTATRPEDDPEKDGFEFGGWYADRDYETEFDFEETPITEDTIVYAKWTEKIAPSFEVSFDANGGGPTPEEQTVEEGETASMPSEDPTWDFGVFDGWYEQIELAEEEIAQIENDPFLSRLVWIDDGKAYIEYDFDDLVFEDTTLHARWIKPVSTVTYIAQGSVVEVLEVPKGEKAPAMEFEPVEGFAFDGWFADEGLSQKFDFDTPVTADITLYSDWSPKTCTVTFNSEGGSPVAAQSVEYEGFATVPADPVKAGKTFRGWYYDLGFEATEQDIAQMAPVEAGYDFEFSDLLWNTNGTTMLKYDLASEPVFEDMELHARWDEGVPTSKTAHTTPAKAAKTGDNPWLVLFAGMALAAFCMVVVAYARYRRG